MIYHVATLTDWHSHLDHAFYYPEAFDKEGFIHCAIKNQVPGVLQRYFAGIKTILLLHIDETKLSAEWKYEKATNEELFPHVFGSINKDAIVTVEEMNF